MKMKTTNENLKFYLNLVNKHLAKKIKLYEAYGNTYIKTESGNDTVFCGTKKQVYDFLVGLERVLNEQI